MEYIPRSRRKTKKTFFDLLFIYLINPAVINEMLDKFEIVKEKKKVKKKKKFKLNFRQWLVVTILVLPVLVYYLYQEIIKIF